MSISIAVPEGHDVRTSLVAGKALVFIGPAGAPGLVPVPPVGQVSAYLTHNRGLSWPDKADAALAAGTLATGGAVALEFACLGDALAFRKRLGAGT